ncbi:MAG TPA: tetratricopeptide repeat protein, partial [Coriobacteriia bacterium]
GDCYHLTGRHKQAAVVYKDALGRCKVHGDTTAPEAIERLLSVSEAPSPRAWEARLCQKVGAAYSRTHCDYERSLAWLDRAWQALPPREVALAAQIDATRSATLAWVGRNEEAVRAARRASAIARRLGDQALRARAATTIAPALQELGELKLSARYRRLALDLYRQVGDLPGQAAAHSNLSVWYVLIGRLDLAVHHSREALRIDERTGDLTGAAITHTNLAENLMMQGETNEALAHLQAALDLCEQAGGRDTTVVGFVLAQFSRAYALQGRNEEATKRLDESVTMLQRTGAATVLAEARLQRAELLLAEGQYAQAVAQCERGLSEARELGMKVVEMRGLRLMGRIERLRLDLSNSERYLRESEDLARRSSAPFDLGLALLDLAETRAAAGRPYRRVLATATALLAPTGAVPDIERARALAEA